MREIPLTQNKVALVDDDIYDYLMQWKWFAVKQKCGDDRFYVGRKQRKGEYVKLSERRVVWLHWAVLECHNIEIPEGKFVDHIDGDGLNNQCHNLRTCTISENGFNRKVNLNKKTSRHKGVSYIRKNNKWRADIGYCSTQYYLGLYDTEDDAAFAYNEKAKELFGEFARLNKIGEKDD